MEKSAGRIEDGGEPAAVDLDGEIGDGGFGSLAGFVVGNDVAGAVGGQDLGGVLEPEPAAGGRVAEDDGVFRGAADSRRMAGLSGSRAGDQSRRVSAARARRWLRVSCVFRPGPRFG